MDLKIGPSFPEELRAAGLNPANVAVAWNIFTGELLNGDLLTKQQRAIWDEVLKAHDPKKLDSDSLRRQSILAEARATLETLRSATPQDIERLAAAPDIVAAILRILALMPLPLTQPPPMPPMSPPTMAPPPQA